MFTKNKCGRHVFVMLFISALVAAGYAIPPGHNYCHQNAWGPKHHHKHGHGYCGRFEQDTGSFSKLTHTKGLTKADYTFDYNRIRDLVDEGTVNQGMFYTKDIDSKETTDFIAKALEIFNANLGLSRTEFRIVDKHIDEVRQLHIITTQYVRGLRVVVSKVALHFDSAGTLNSITGQYMPNQNLSTTPRISAGEAIEFGKEAVDDSSTVEGTPELAFVDERLVYVFKLVEEDVPGWWNIVVDAWSGEVLQKSSSVRYLSPPGFPSNGSISQITGNIVTNEEATSGEQATVNGWHDNTNNHWYLFNNSEHWQVIDANASPNALFNTTSSNWGTTTRPGMTIARNIKRVLTYAQNALGQNSFDGAGAMCYCYNRDYHTNDPGGAWWDGSSFMFTNGVGVAYEEVVLDLVAHEFGHALTQYHSDLDYDRDGSGNWLPSAVLNEMYSDINGACAEFYCEPDGRDHYPLLSHSVQAESDWLIGEDCIHNGTIRWWDRNMRDPGHDPYGPMGNTPSFYRDRDWRSGGYLPHFNSLVGSFAFYLITEGANVELTNRSLQYGPFRGLGINTARNIAWGAQFDGVLLQNADYFACRNAWIATARNHEYNAGIVAQAWAAVGIIDRTVNKPSGVTLYSDPPDPPNYTTISAAISAASNGELIYVFPGTYTENLNITKSDLTIVSRNRDLTTIMGSITLASTADGVTITGFTVNPGTSNDAVTLSGTNGTNPDYLLYITLAGNRFQNCRNGVAMMNYAYRNRLFDNQFSGCTNSSVYFYISSQSYMADNKINGTGIQIDFRSNFNFIYRNRLENITGNGVSFNATPMDLNDIGLNEIMNISGYDIYAAGIPTNLSVGQNVFSNQNTVDMFFPTGSTGVVARNVFAANAYNITATPSGYPFYFYNSLNEGNYWNNYTGVDNNGDGKGDTYLPHLGLDYYPFMRPQSRALHIDYNGATQMASSVCGNLFEFLTDELYDEQFRISGTVQSGTPSGLVFTEAGGVNVAGVSSGGNLTGSSQTLIFSGPWLDQPANLTGGLVLTDAAGKVQMHISRDGIIRTRNGITPNF